VKAGSMSSIAAFDTVLSTATSARIVNARARDAPRHPGLRLEHERVQINASAVRAREHGGVRAHREAAGTAEELAELERAARRAAGRDDLAVDGERVRAVARRECAIEPDASASERDRGGSALHCGVVVGARRVPLRVERER
jgi:hypothetical protein